MKRFLIRADDLGYSKAVNYGIYEAVHNGIINNVGLMVNMPDTMHGLKLLKNENVDLGLHVVISAGKPITDPKKVPSLTTNEGFFKASKVYRTIDKDFVDLNEVLIEIEAQYQKFVELTGRQPDYFEGHAVASDNLVKGLKVIAKRHKAPFLDFTFENSTVRFKSETFRPLMESMKDNYDPFVTFKKGIAEADNKASIPMMICHPGYLDDYILKHSSLTIPRTKEVTMACAVSTKKIVEDENVKLVRYSELQ